MARRTGFPVFGQSDPLMLLQHSLTSATDIPNAAGAAIGSAVEFDPIRGCRTNIPVPSVPNYTSDFANYRIVYDGTVDATAWHPDRNTIGEVVGLTIAYVVERAVFECAQDAYIFNPARTIPLIGQWRGATSSKRGMTRIGPSAAGLYDAALRCDHEGSTAQSSFHSQYANDKDFVPIVVSIRRNYIDHYVDGMHANRATISQWDADEYRDLYLKGANFNDAGNEAPAGCPFWIRNLTIINRPVILVADPRHDRLTFAGDSVVGQGDYDTGGPRYDAAHKGNRYDAGMTPMVERLMHRDGFYTTDLHNSGRTGAAISATPVSAPYSLISQFDGTESVEYDARTSGGKILVIHCGLNDVTLESGSIPQTLTDYEAVIAAAKAEGFTDIVACNVYGCRDATGVNNSPAVIESRTTELNAGILSIANATGGVHHCDIYAAMGGVPASPYLDSADEYHANAEGHSRIGRAIYDVLSSFLEQ